MSKKETQRIAQEHRRLKLTRPRTEEYKREEAIFLMGYITALRDQEKLFRAGEAPVSQDLADLCLYREQTIVKQLRKL